MHAIFFAIKRVQHGALAVLRDLIAPLPLTPARFDMLYAVAKRSRLGHELRQSDLRRELGVTSPCVSRMIRALEALGLVARRRCERDRRQIRLRVTEKGANLFVRIVNAVHRTNVVTFVVACVFADHWFNAPVAMQELGELETSLTRMRRALRDRSSLDYPFHVDD